MPLLTNMRSRFLGGGRLAVPVPVLGAELITDGGLENWNSATDLTSWTETLSGTSTVNRESSGVHGGTYASRHDIDAGGGNAKIEQALTAAAGWFHTVYWAKRSTAGSVRLVLGATNGTIRNAMATWTEYIETLRAGANPTVALQRAAGTSISLYFDDVSIKAIILASMFSVRPFTTHMTTKAKATVVSGTRAGVVANLDSTSNPQNFVIVSHDGVQTARMSKCVAGTYTEWSATVAYVAGAYVEVRRPAGGDIWQMFYNGNQVIADQTISDAAIKAATLHGMFNTYAGNTLSGFTCVPS